MDVKVFVEKYIWRDCVVPCMPKSCAPALSQRIPRARGKLKFKQITSKTRDRESKLPNKSAGKWKGDAKALRLELSIQVG